MLAFGAFAVGAFAVAAFILAAEPVPSLATDGGAVIELLLLAFMCSLIASRWWIAEIDLSARTLRIFRRSLGRWTRTVVDCPLDQCRRLGRYEAEGDFSYGVYVELIDGSRHAIPLKGSSFEEAGRVASQLSEATGISRLDTRF